jgi:prepilin-type N-terminal cleavage/methylation domain-containing protein/prepilin-type processing-associated H-X9-DG protein
MNHRLSRFSSTRAFTLTELLVAITVTVVLAAILLPAIASVRKKSAVAESTSNLRNLTSATTLVAQERGGRLPKGNEWRHLVYPVLYGGKDWPGFIPWETGENLKGTAFYDPLKEYVDEGEPIRSYGLNVYFAGRTSFRYGETARTFLFATSKNTSDLNTADLEGGQFSDRADGKVLVGFLDGHVEAMDLEEIPEERETPFWGVEKTD